jgi:hypothetical protein
MDFGTRLSIALAVAAVGLHTVATKWPNLAATQDQAGGRSNNAKPAHRRRLIVVEELGARPMPVAGEGVAKIGKGGPQ